MDENLELAFLSLEGLALGDAFGEQFFRKQNRALIPRRQLPAGIWRWTDDTHMALSIVEMLEEAGTIIPDELAKKFAYRFSKDAHRGYGRGAAHLLSAIANGASWRDFAPKLFNGGSYGNGAAMRVAPLGAYFNDDINRLTDEAMKSAMVTHYHPEGQAGAVAVALGAAYAAREILTESDEFFGKVLQCVPESEVKDKIFQASKIPKEEHQRAADELGTGRYVSAQDTVPYCLWCATHYGHSYEDALWMAIRHGGDLDTLGAIVGGIVVLNVKKLPEDWLAHREPLKG
jgi:ADP-ribosylglycohydrolase